VACQQDGEDIMTPLDLGTPCEIWPGRPDRAGHGRVRSRGPNRGRFVHRVAYEEAYGAIPAGLVIGHMCHVKAAEAGLCAGGNSDPHRRCVNPLHLQAMSREEWCVASPLTIYGKNQRKMICPKGHPLTVFPYSVDERPKGRRWCHTCRLEDRRVDSLTPEQREVVNSNGRRRFAALTPEQREARRVYNQKYYLDRKVAS